MTENTPDPGHPELWEWLTDEDRAAWDRGEQLTDEQLDAAADRRRAQAQPEDETNVRYLPARQVEAPGGGFLAISAGQTSWNDEQVAALVAHCNIDPNTPKGEVLAFLHLCQRSGLDPLANEIYLIGRKERGGRMKFTAQTGIDGFRHIAERTGEYLGKEGPWWCGPDGQWTDVWLSDAPPSAARVTVLRAGRPETTATVLYREFVPMQKVYEGSGDARRPKRVDGKDVEEPAAMWKKMPAHMLAKCAEALSIRQAFPRHAAGIYSDDEMDQADARARAWSEDEAREERDRQRRELTSRLPSGPGDPARLADVSEGQVIQGEVARPGEVLDREALMAELEEQARLMATTVTAMTRRWVAANRKNLEDATDAEVAEIVRERRAFVVGLAVKEAEAATEVPPEGEGTPDSAAQDPQGGVSGPDTPTPAAQVVETEAEREARREAVEARARQVAKDSKRRKDAETRAATRKPTEQGTLDGSDQ